MTFDNEQELYKIKTSHPKSKCVLRIITNDSNAICKFSVKLDLNLVGISFHVGSSQLEASTYSESIRDARLLFDYTLENLNNKMHLLDLDSGFPGSSDSKELFNK